MSLPAMILAALASSIPAYAAAAAPPSGASEVIARVGRAARQSDYAALRADMIEEFTWSFGGFAEWTVIEGLLARSARKAFGVEDQQAVAFQQDPATVDKIGQRLVRRLP